MIRELVLKCRSYRRFHEDHIIDRETLTELIDLARLSGSAANLQPLKYIISCDKEKNSRIYPHLAWAAYLSDWKGPDEGERPSGYIIILQDNTINKTLVQIDHGIAAQSILLGAVEKGLGGCMIASLKKDDLRNVLNIPEQFEILMVITLGKPKEVIIIDDVEPGGSIKYWRDEKRAHHVPKRSLKDIIID